MCIFLSGSFHVKCGISCLSTLNGYNFGSLYSMKISLTVLDSLGLKWFFSNHSIFVKTFYFRIF